MVLALAIDSFRKIEQLMRCEPIPEPAVKQLCLKAREVLIEEGNVQHVDSPVTVRHFPLLKHPCLFTLRKDMWRHSWPILRHARTFQNGRHLP